MLGYSEETVKFTEDIKARAQRYGFPLVGIVSAEEYDAYEGHYIGHRQYKCNTKKTGDYMEGAKSLIILGVQVWDSLFDMVIKVGEEHEYPDEWRGRYYARRMMRHLGKLGYRTELEPELLSKKRMAHMAGLGSFGKQTLIVNPEFGPWIRLRSILTDAQLVPTGPVVADQCADCDECIEACPTGALSPYKVDPDKCLLGMTWEARNSPELHDIYMEHSPDLTENTWLMCNTCQKACPIGHDLRFEKRGRGGQGH
jgi:epoxyqueuosine reductase QueG